MPVTTSRPRADDPVVPTPSADAAVPPAAAWDALPAVAPVVGFPHLRLRGSDDRLLDLPWELPLGEWRSDTLRFKQLPVGPSRHLVRFLYSHDRVLARNELPLGVAEREFEV